MNLTSLLSEYVLALEAGAAKTARAEDRPIYQALLADAAGLLALAATNASLDDIRARFKAHERLWGNVWLVDPVFTLPAAALERSAQPSNRGGQGQHRKEGVYGFGLVTSEGRAQAAAAG